MKVIALYACAERGHRLIATEPVPAGCDDVESHVRQVNVDVGVRVLAVLTDLPAPQALDDFWKSRDPK